MSTVSPNHQRNRKSAPLYSTKLKTASNSSLSSSYKRTADQPPPLPISCLSTKDAAAATSWSNTRSPPQVDGGTSPRLRSFGEASLEGVTMHPIRPSTFRSATDDRNGNQNLEVGDSVDVPGGMHGTIKFIGEVQGKKGVFAGVELAKEWAARGKNDGDVEGIRYFTTSIKGAGIFLPSTKAYKRLSPALSSGDSLPLTPTTSTGTQNSLSRGGKTAYTPPTPSMTPKFSQSVGPGRVPSPTLKAKRPSLPRPESPLRKAQHASSTPQPRPSLGKPNLSKSMMGGSRYAPSPTPARFGASVSGTRDLAGDPGKRAPATPKPVIRKPTGSRPLSPSRSESRSESRLGPEPMFDEESDNTPVAVSKKAAQNKPSMQRSGPSFSQDSEVRNLRSQLEERDRQLEKYAGDLEEMQSSIAELQNFAPRQNVGTTRASRGSGMEDLDVPSLRALVREKNERIVALTQEFDSHRADFRETIDVLERTSDETNRLHEDRIGSLEADLRAQMSRDDDVESVAQQLILLEKHVEELEEGLEDSRRGESEARGEVEHLRGEVERGKAELRREREKAAASQRSAGEATSDATWQREIAHRDNEINGLKAIIHSLSRDASSSPNSPRSSRRSKHNSKQADGQAEAQLTLERQAREKLEREIEDLQSHVDRKTYREEELENEITFLRKHASQVTSISNGHSDRTVVPSSNPVDHPEPWKEAAPMSYRPKTVPKELTRAPSSDGGHSTTMTESSALWCEMCETSGHDILHCTSVGGGSSNHAPSSYEPTGSSSHTKPNGAASAYASQHAGKLNAPHPDDFPAPLSPARSPAPDSGRNRDDGMAAGSSSRSQQPQSQASRMPNPLDNGMVAGKESGVIDQSKWCAMCEHDGHGSVDCPFEMDAY